ncbi:MAG: DUF4292 domain-containing protein [Chitinophagia bacterium]|nr:DUF4292 domain-containing protein [Chitinophagia bacterium]
MNKALRLLALGGIMFYCSSCTLYEKIPFLKHKKKNTALADTAAIDTIAVKINDDNSNVVITTDTVKKVDTPLTIADTPKASLPLTLLASIPYTSLSAKAKIHFEIPNESQDLTAVVKLITHQKLLINIYAFSAVVQAAKLYITPDSLVLIDYLHKEVHRVPTASIDKILPVKISFSALENALFGKLLSNDSLTQMSTLANTLLLSLQNSTYLQHIALSAKDTTLLRNTIEYPGDTTLHPTFIYSDYIKIDSINLPTHIESRTRKASQTYYIDYYLKNIDINNVSEININIPAGYTIYND